MPPDPKLGLGRVLLGAHTNGLFSNCQTRFLAANVDAHLNPGGSKELIDSDEKELEICPVCICFLMVWRSKRALKGCVEISNMR